MTSVAELQYFGCIEWYKTLLKSSNVLIESCEQYQKMSFRNRMVIAGANGLLHLSIPLENGRNQAALIRDVRISDTGKWQLNHWRAIRSAYSRSPYFGFYEDELKGFYEKKYEYLWDFNMMLFYWIIAKMRLHLRPVLTNQYIDSYPPESGTQDHRNRWLPKNFQQTPGQVIYRQVFEDRIGFQHNLSVVDLLFCEGPDAFARLK